MKVIFLDVDGVLNNVKTPHSTRDGHLHMTDVYCVALVNLLAERTGARLVLSSDWRHLTNWREVMKANGIVHEFLDATPKRADFKRLKVNPDDLVRGHEIEEWLMDHPDVEDYVILDDVYDFLVKQHGHVFKTSWATGITDEVAKAAEEYLNGKADEQEK